MRHLTWMVPAFAILAVTGYFLAQGATEPAAVARPRVKNMPAEEESALPNLAKVTPAHTAPELPVTQVVLYSSGMGYFQRDGQVEGNTWVDLSFPVQDINDLLKSMVLQDLGGGQIRAVALDSHDPADKTLSGFSIRLAGNPSHAQILNQARGENVEITLAQTSPASVNESRLAKAEIQGTIVGVEVKPASGKDNPVTETLTLWCSDGMRSIPLAQIQRLKFLNPTVESEVKRALDVLASTHDSQKKSVSLQFNGTGPRPVRVAYVVETPVWRTSYRLLVDEGGKLFVQGWALVQNPTNEDWKDVRVGLVSGRPVSFKMDLYQPQYVARPYAQTEQVQIIGPTNHSAGVNLGNGPGTAPAPVPPGPMTYSNGATLATVGAPMTPGIPSMHSGNAGGGAVSGIQFAMPGQPAPPPPQPVIDLKSGIAAAATASDLSGSFKYTIDQPVTIPRQKSALLPVVSGPLEGDKVCVYNAQVDAKHPLLALRLKNVTGNHLMSGPVAIFEESGYRGDTHMPYLRPGEERLVSYALDLNTDVDSVFHRDPSLSAKVKFSKGKLTLGYAARETTQYKVKNTGKEDRVLFIEHPVHEKCTLVSKVAPKEQAKDVYRFELKAAAGKSADLEVIEEKRESMEVPLQRIGGTKDAAMSVMIALFFLLGNEANVEKGKEAFEELRTLGKKVVLTSEETEKLHQQINELMRDQDRVRANLKDTPPASAVYKRFLDKLDSQETTIERLQTQAKDLQATLEKLIAVCDAHMQQMEAEVTIPNFVPNEGAVNIFDVLGGQQNRWQSMGQP